MAKEISKNKENMFEKIKHTDENGNEYWMAREFSKALGYTDFRNFIGVIEKAWEASKNSDNDPSEHIVEANEVLIAGQGAKHMYPSYKLSRYACYLIVQNADPSKEVVALGQTYFAVQTRIQEIQQMDAYNSLRTEEERRIFLRNEMSKHNTYLAAAAKNAGVQDGLDYAIFQNHGYAGLYGGLDAKGIHKHKGLKKSQHILDHMGSTELAANLFRAT
ncbi:DNA damage-inducible protein D [Proteiniphilum sp.]|uniref:DNA damage-inducible protein D n=1 Tax=Proteiniphilum sp. TaxID=1926877 RepID=UPI002B202BB6|nr:DNA damage-inducible protein D [Proteiniphilum sp.]MEA4917017.1 DNA damage-inducible protein D [Proteiniphilum sp.]